MSTENALRVEIGLDLVPAGAGDGRGLVDGVDAFFCHDCGSRKPGFYSGRCVRMQVGCAPSMPEERTDDLVGRRLALYAYLEPLLSGRRVLEIEARSGRGAVPAGESTQYLRSLGARVVTVDRDATVDDRFDVVRRPRGGGAGPPTGSVRRAAQAARRRAGALIVAAANADRGARRDAATASVTTSSTARWRRTSRTSRCWA